ncbi:sugar ABC transporter ATP-binding protein [Neogemmobacter tilapiae]|uniref:Autoinducer 2 import ATP-binding protein LsrA n=1 Tax=Neogemmobacter tilapiae TaxID=875041 RepID=A0A918TX01_9RHOB|nr:sugar ABC transporter ATP-binding protein [Gemmobacter tilapiae]GHC60388.1 ribose import ATP-binding protein RbsA 2 [Gemmobacter tilapiae]
MTPPLLQLSDIHKSFGAIKALRGAQLELRAGEIHALMGENGAGKSTLMNIIDGILQPSSGEIRIDGQRVQIDGPATAQRLGIGLVHQEIALCADISVAENIFMARTAQTKRPLMDSADLVARARAVLAPLAEIDPRLPAGRLSISQQQLVEIAKALTLDCRILILDEPTAALTELEAQKLFTILRGLAARGIGIIYISHRMAEIFANCDRVTVMRDGQHIRTDEVADLTPSDVVNAMVGRKLDTLYPPKMNGERGAEILRVQGLTDRRYQDVSFTLHKGEILGIGGLIGAGRSEIARGVTRLEGAAKGRVWLNGQEVVLRDYADCIARGIVYLSEDRKGDGIFLDMPIAANVSALNLRQVAGRFGVIDSGAETAQAQSIGETLRLKAGSMGHRVASLSGGNQQKVALAKLLAVKPRVIFLDEPTRGVDVGAKAEIHAILRGLAESGVGIAVISSEMPELIGLCDRVMVVSEGRLTGELSGPDITEAKIMTLAAPGALAASRNQN